jgi:hypothetical protein
MRTRQSYSTASGHYHSGTGSSKGKRVYKKIEFFDPELYFDFIYPQTIGREICVDNVHYKNHGVWQKGDCTITKNQNTGTSAVMARPSGSTHYVCHGGVYLTVNDLTVLSSVQQTLSDYEVIQKYQPAQETLSIPNMLFELKDFKQMMRTLHKVPRLLKDLWKFSTINTGLRFQRYILKEGAEQHLNTQFGVLPTLGDIFKLVEAAIGLDDEVAKIKREAGKILTRRGNIECSLELPETWFSMTRRETSAFIKEIRGSGQVSVSRQFIGTYTYYLPTIHDWSNLSLDSQLKRRLLGLRSLSVADVWQAIPWSWLADWIFNVSKTLGKDTIVPVACIDACYVTKIKITMSDHEIDWGCKLSSAYGVTTKVGDINAANPVFTIYDRKYINTDVNPLEALALKGLNAKQLSLLGAIGMTSRRR